jgi:mono/diheme cytochrome c family protein
LRLPNFPLRMPPFATHNRRLGLLFSVGLTALGLGAGCGAPATVATRPEQGAWKAPAAPPDRAHIVAVYQSHCGACHRPVAPGSEPEDHVHAELLRHRKRARLTDQEWAGLDAFLTSR